MVRPFELCDQIGCIFVTTFVFVQGPPSEVRAPEQDGGEGEEDLGHTRLS